MIVWYTENVQEEGQNSKCVWRMEVDFGIDNCSTPADDKHS